MEEIKSAGTKKASSSSAASKPASAATGSATTKKKAATKVKAQEQPKVAAPALDAPEPVAAPVAAPVVAADVAAVQPVAAAPVNSSVRRPKFNKDEDIWVVSQFPGELHYVSKRTGYEIVWAEMGAGEWMSYEELTSMANSQKKFFERNWIMLDPEVLFSLRMERYYVNSLSLEEYETIFDVPVERMELILNQLPPGQKKTIAYRAQILISEKQIDSNRRIEAIERALGTQFGNS